LRLKLVDSRAQAAELEPAIRERNLREQQNEQYEEKNEPFGAHEIVLILQILSSCLTGLQDEQD